MKPFPLALPKSSHSGFHTMDIKIVLTDPTSLSEQYVNEKLKYNIIDVESRVHAGQV